MAAVTVRNIPDETLRALKLRAAQCGRSTEAEIRAILEKRRASENWPGFCVGGDRSCVGWRGIRLTAQAQPGQAGSF